MPIRFTDRLAELQATEWERESSEEALRQIAELGLTKIHVIGDEHSMSWTYSTGMFDTWGQPEIIMTGFPQGLASSILHGVAKRNAAGEFVDANVRVPNLISNFDCIFRPVEHAWIHRLMLRTTWFYGEISFPVLQCICPDFSNRFPWEQGFDEAWRLRQALLFEGVGKTEAEKKLWNASGSEVCN